MQTSYFVRITGINFPEEISFDVLGVLAISPCPSKVSTRTPEDMPLVFKLLWCTDYCPNRVNHLVGVIFKPHKFKKKKRPCSRTSKSLAPFWKKLPHWWDRDLKTSLILTSALFEGFYVSKNLQKGHLLFDRFWAHLIRNLFKAIKNNVMTVNALQFGVSQTTFSEQVGCQWWRVRPTTCEGMSQKMLPFAALVRINSNYSKWNACTPIELPFLLFWSCV